MFKHIKNFFSARAPKKKQPGHQRRSEQTTADALPAEMPEWLSAQNRYGHYCVPKSSAHRPAARRILNGMVHEPRTIRFIRQHCGTGDVVHAGTYFGDFIPGIASGLGPQALLWAFEPVKENYLCAQGTVNLNKLDNVHLHHAGLGSKKGVLAMVTTDKQGAALGGGSRIAVGNRQNTVPVNILCIDDVIPENRQVSVIQLDVEGQELPALQGAIKTIARCRPILVLEVLEKNTVLESAWVRQHLLEQGYQIRGKVHENAVLSVEPVHL